MSGGDGRAPVGIFDSGVGGMTVLSAVHRLLPGENLHYIGDTARVPYGGKSAETVLRYSREIAAHLIGQGAKMIVAACNTASALAIRDLADEVSVPVLGVVEPGAAAAVRATRNGRIGVIGTRATIGSGAYEAAIRRIDPSLDVRSAACPLFVPLIEEGWFGEPETHRIAARYIEPLLRDGVDTLVLGCTHYPLLAGCLREVAGPDVALVDSARNCAEAVAAALDERGLAASGTAPGSLRVGLTDVPDSFLPVVERELGLRIPEIEYVQAF